LVALLNLSKSLRKNAEFPQALKLLQDIEYISKASGQENILIDA